MRLRIVNRRRLVITILLVTVALVIILSVVHSQADREYATRTVYVESGDSIWSLAQSNNNTDIPIREYVSLVCRTNNITPMIHPGQAIEFPVLE